MTWFGLLKTFALSASCAVYNVTTALSRTRLHLPDCVLDELAIFIGRIPIFEIDFQRSWQDCLVATDASVNFGFGVALALLDPRFVCAVGLVAGRPRQIPRLTRDGGSDDEP